MAKKGMGIGQGGRFQKLEGQLAKEKGVTDPAALAASIAAKKYGRKRLTKMAAVGRKRAPQKP